jgi:hypothetical protein
MRVFLVLQREYMPGDSKCQTEILDVYSNLEIANAAGKEKFKSIWEEYTEAGDARKTVFVRDEAGKDYVALMKVPGSGRPDRFEIRVEERKVLSKVRQMDLQSVGDIVGEAGPENAGHSILNIGLRGDNGRQISGALAGDAPKASTQIQVGQPECVPARNENSTKRKNEEDGIASHQPPVQKRQKVVEGSRIQRLLHSVRPA